MQVVVGLGDDLSDDAADKETQGRFWANGELATRAEHGADMMVYQRTTEEIL